MERELKGKKTIKQTQVKDLNIRNVKHEKAAMEKYAEKCIFVNT
jgi:hypothetical protein